MAFVEFATWVMAWFSRDPKSYFFERFRLPTLSFLLSLGRSQNLFFFSINFFENYLNYIATKEAEAAPSLILKLGILLFAYFASTQLVPSLSHRY